jgi:two-component sensor histidine kinase
MDEKDEIIKQLEASLNERNILLKEVYHRVKNNFQVIISLINLEIESVDNPLARQILIECITRIKAMVLGHDSLYQSAHSSEIKMQLYIKDLLRFPIAAYSTDNKQIKLLVDVEPISLPIDSAILCGLIINELITNAIKYAFPLGKTGQITVSLKTLDKTVTLLVKDNGVGIPNNFDIQTDETLGMRLIVTLANRLGGEVALKNDHGTSCAVSFIKGLK